MLRTAILVLAVLATLAGCRSAGHARAEIEARATTSPRPTADLAARVTIVVNF
jgi:hypothetical protein